MVTASDSRWNAALVLVAVFSVAFLGACSSHHDIPASKQPATAVLPEADARRLETGLTSPATAAAVAVLAPALRARYAHEPFELLPSGSTLTVDAQKLVVTGDTATVPATVTGPEPGSWVLLLVRDGDHWAAYGTRKAAN